MKKIINLLIIYNLLASVFVIFGGIINVSKLSDFITILLFLPLFLYFLLLFFKKTPIIKHKFPKERYGRVTKILSIYGFFFSAILFLSLLGNIKSFIEFVFLLILAPFEIYFALIVIDKINKNSLVEHEDGNSNKTESKSETKFEIKEPVALEEVKGEKVETPKEVVREKDRRDFLKILASAGLGVALTGLINPQKAGAAFFGSVPGPGTISVKDTTGTRIDPAIKSPTDGYGIMNTDESSYPYYYGFVNKDGAWYIVKAASDGSFTYAKGASGYNWSARAGQTYASYDSTF